MLANGYDHSNIERRVVGQGMANLMRGWIGPGIPTGRGNSLSLYLLEPGDIILGGNQGSTYGYYTHAALYQGEGRAWEGWLSTGIREMKVARFLNYDWACILRVKTDSAVRNQAVSYVAEHRGGLFFPLAFKSGERIWNCTKIIWKAYQRQGVDLDAGQDLWVTPDNLYHSPLVEIITESGSADDYRVQTSGL